MQKTETQAAATDTPVSAAPERKEKIPFPAVIVIYSVLFYGIWAVFEFVGKPFLADLHMDPVVEQLIKSGLVKNLVWTLPALLLIKKYEDRVHIPLKELFTSKVDIKLWAALFLLFPIFTVLPKYIKTHTLSINPEFTVLTAIGFLFVGITEESVFRGWLLNAAYGTTKGSKVFAYALNGVMFVMIHIPTWITNGQLDVAFGKFGFLSIMMIGFIFGLLMTQTRNLLVPVVMHMYYDTLLDLFI